MQIKISDSLNVILGFAREEAMRTGCRSIGADHLILGLIRHGDNDACDALKALEVDLQELKQFIDSKIFTDEHIPFSELDNIQFSRTAHNILSFTVLEAVKTRASEAGPVHLLLALAKISGSFGQSYLRDTGVDYGRIAGFLDRAGMLLPSRNGSKSDETGEEESEGGAMNNQELLSDHSEDPLGEFGYDLTKAAAEGRLDPVVGRDEEIARVIQILGRRKKNNPMLIGEPGVGKSAIVEGIALRIADGRIPEALRGKKLVTLDIASVVAGTRYRGDFEKRIKNIISQLSANPDIILFIDEFHTIVGAGSASGSLDAANMLKPALARGEIQCIGATTMEEFRKTVEKDGALDRRFQKVVVEAADLAYSVKILDQLRKNYEAHHKVVYTDEAIEACVKLTDRYISDRCLPDKAIDAMDEAGSMVRLRRSRNPRASVKVSPADVATVVSQMSGIPAGRMAVGESDRLLRMAERLKSHIIGQDEAVDTVVRAIQRGRAGIKDPNRPIGSFLFFGPTGVGKTKLAKQIADYLFDSEENMVRIDMSEYMEKFNVSRLVGAPPGYVGFDEGGQLSEQVRRKPYCVVLLDEIEKAHPDIFNLLLQVLDEGRLTDSNGRTVYFRNTIVIMTSNVGTRELEDYGKGIGFMTSARDLAYDRQAVVSKAIRKTFPPEFINRIDELVCFKPLGKQEIAKIIDIEIKELRARMSEAGFRLNISQSAKDFVAEAGYDPNYGARPLKRAIQKYIENPVSEFIIADRTARRLSRAASEGRTLRIGLSPSGDTLDLKLAD